MKLNFWCICLWAVIGSLELYGQEKTWSQVYAESKDRIPVILSSGAICSGALIEKDLVLTAAHCVSSLREVFLFWKQDYSKVYSGTVQALNRDQDLALVKFPPMEELAPLPLVALDQAPVVGEEVATIGHPTPEVHLDYPPFDKDNIYLLSRGIISQTNAKSLISDISVSPGNSGGPAFNQRGEIVGVVSRKRVDRWVGNIAYFAPPQKISDFVEQSKKEKQEVSIFKAKTTLDLSIWYNQWLTDSANSTNSSGMSESFENSNNIEWMFKAEVWDRLTLGVSHWLGGDVRTDTSYFLGWKFQYITPELTIWNITPGISQWNYEDQKSMLGFSVIFEHSWLPLSLRYTFTNNETSRSIFSLGLNFF